MNMKFKMAFINVALLVMLAVPIGLKSAESNALAIATNAANRKTAEDKMEVMKGAWEIQTQGTQGNWGQDVKALTRTFILVFSGDKKEKIPITGSPFGFKIIKSSLQTAKRGDVVRFKAVYHLDKDYDIDFHGRLNEDGTEISDGKFSFVLGKGTFTGKKSD